MLSLGAARPALASPLRRFRARARCPDGRRSRPSRASPRGAGQPALAGETTFPSFRFLAPSGSCPGTKRGRLQTAFGVKHGGKANSASHRRFRRALPAAREVTPTSRSQPASGRARFLHPASPAPRGPGPQAPPVPSAGEERSRRRRDRRTCQSPLQDAPECSEARGARPGPGSARSRGRRSRAVAHVGVGRPRAAAPPLAGRARPRLRAWQRGGRGSAGASGEARGGLRARAAGAGRPLGSAPLGRGSPRPGAQDQAPTPSPRRAPPFGGAGGGASSLRGVGTRLRGERGAGPEPGGWLEEPTASPRSSSVRAFH